MSGRGRPNPLQEKSSFLTPQAPQASRRGRNSPQKKRNGRGGKGAAATISAEPSFPKNNQPNISWTDDHTNKLVDWILTRPANRHILFLDCTSSSKTTLNTTKRPSGKNKKEVAGAIAKHIFETDEEHLATYASDPSRYVLSVTNQLGVLKTKYRHYKEQFQQTGNGVAPQGLDETAGPSNLLGMFF
ncbi:hypothetical protein JVU11DRAFT_11489 [Chiua virens]|nr:hypothetical protein JVU11DRAFT_11489 [Chiua virens]